MAYKPYFQDPAHPEIVFTDDDGDGVFDDVHHVTSGEHGVLHFDGDGDGFYDDSIYGVNLDPDPEPSTSTKEEEERQETTDSNTPPRYGKRINWKAIVFSFAILAFLGIVLGGLHSIIGVIIFLSLH